MFGLLSRLLLFVLLIWVARGLLQILRGASTHRVPHSRNETPPVNPPADPARSKLNLSKDDVIDVPYTDVDPKP